MVLVVIRFNKFEAGHRGAFRCYQRGGGGGDGLESDEGVPNSRRNFSFLSAGV